MAGSFAGGFAGGVIGTLAVEIIADTSGLDKDLSGVQKSLAGLAVGGFAVAAKAGIDFESSFAGVRKTVNGTEADLAGISSGLRGMAKEIPVNVNGLNDIAASAGQLGIQTPNVLGFTRVIADLGVATNLTGEQGATMLARFANITQMDQGSFDRLGSTIVALGNNSATTEAEIAELGLRLAGAGQQAGMSEADILGISAALSSLGINAEAGGTAFSTVMIKIGNAVMDGGEDLENFARVAGMSADEFAAKWKAEPAEALILFVEGLARIDEEGGNTNAALEALGLGGIRVGDALRRAAGGGDILRESVKLGNDAWRENTALTKEAEERYKTTASQIAIAKNNVNDLAISAGTRLLPAIVGATGALVGFTDAFSALPESTQNILLLTGAAMALGPVIVALSRTTVGALAAMRAGALTTAGTMTLALGGIGIAAIALDGLLKKTTGDGLFGSFGADAKIAEIRAEGADRAIRSLTIAMEVAGETVPSLDTAVDQLGKIEKAAGDAVVKVAEVGPVIANAFGVDVAAAESAKGAIEGIVNAMKDAGAPAHEILKAVNGLNDGPLREWALQLDAVQYAQEAVNAQIHDGVNLASETTQRWLGWATAAEGVKQPLVDLPGIIQGVTDVQRIASEVTTEYGGAFVGLGDSVQIFTTRVGDTTTIVTATSGPFADFIQNLRDTGTEAITLDDYIRELNDALHEMTSAFADANPEMASLRLQEAQLKDEKAELIALYGDQNEAANERIATIDTEMKRNGELQESMRTDQTLVERAIENIGAWAKSKEDATAATLHLVDTMRESGRTLQEQENYVNKLSVGWESMAKGDLPTAISMFSDLKAELAPSEWAIIAEAVGPEFMAAVQSGVSDPAALADLMESAKDLGFATGDGAVEGIEDKKDDVADAASGLIDGVSDATADADAAGGKLGEAAGEGAVKGLAGKEGDVVAAAKGLIDLIRTFGPDAEAAGSAVGAQTPVGMATGIMAGTSDILAAARAAAQAGTGASGDAYAAGSTVGVNFGDGISAGIAARAWAIAQAAIAAVRGALAAATGIYGIDSSSPSKKTRDLIGLPFVQGIVVGIERGTPELETSAIGAVTSLIDVLVASLKNEEKTVQQAAAETLMLRQFEADVTATYGDAGAEAAMAFVDALVSGSTADQQRFIDSLYTWLDGLGLIGTEMGDAIIANAIAALEGGAGEITTFIESLPTLVSPDMGTEWAKVIVGEQFHDSLVERFGEAGAASLEKLNEVLHEGGPDLVSTVAELAIEAAKEAGIWGTEAGEEWLRRVEAAILAGDLTGVGILFADILPEVETPADRWAELFHLDRLREQLITILGEAGADAAMALYDAIAAGDVDSAFRTAMELLEAAGIDAGSETGRAFLDSLLAMFESGDYTIKDIVDLIFGTEGMVEAAESAADAIVSSYEAAMTDADRLERMGSAGKAVFDAIAAAGDEFSAEEATRIGDLLAQWELDLAKKLGPETAKKVMKPFWDAWNQAMREGRNLSEQEWADLFANMNLTAEQQIAMLETIVGSLGDVFVETLESMSDDGTITWDNIWDNLATIAETGVITIDGKMVTLSEAMRERLLELLELYEQGLIDFQTFAEGLDTIGREAVDQASGGSAVGGGGPPKMGTAGGGPVTGGAPPARPEDTGTVMTDDGKVHVRQRTHAELVKIAEAALYGTTSAEHVWARDEIAKLNPADRRELELIMRSMRQSVPAYVKDPLTGSWGPLSGNPTYGVPPGVALAQPHWAVDTRTPAYQPVDTSQYAGMSGLERAWSGAGFDIQHADIEGSVARSLEFLKSSTRAEEAKAARAAALAPSVPGGGGGAGLTVNGNMVFELPSSAAEGPQEFATAVLDVINNVWKQQEFGPDALAHGVGGA